jgi:predicted nucleotidyltransferase
MLTAIRRTLNAATGFAVVRVPMRILVRVLCSFASWLLRRSGSVAAVYVRGSYARGDFRPFISDIDLAILVRGPPRRGYEVCRLLHQRLRLVRVVNPFVRDLWQTILTEPQWPLVARYGYLFGIDDWQLIAGEAPWSGTAPINERLFLAACWNRQHFWTALAVQQAMKGQTSLRALGASLKKAQSYAGKISDRLASDRFAIGSRHASDGEDMPLTLPQALGELAQSAELLIHGLNLETSPEHPEEGGDWLAEPTPRESQALAGIGEALDLERDIISVIGTEGFLVLITGRKWSPEEYSSALERLARVYRTTGMLTFVYSEKAFSLAPLRRRLRVLRVRKSSTSTSVPGRPLLLMEQLLYEGLYTGTHIWVVSGRRDRRRRLELHVAQALELCAFFLTGDLCRDTRSLWDALAEVQSLDPATTIRLNRISGLLGLVSSRSEMDEKALFEIGSVVSARLSEILAGFDIPSGHPHVVAAL